MAVEPLNPDWQQAVTNSIAEIYNCYGENKAYLLTEGDLECQLFSSLKQQDIVDEYKDTKKDGWRSGFIHSQITWFRTDRRSGFEVDITIFDPANLDINDFFEPNNFPHKGYFHDGPCIAIEIKFIRINVRGAIRESAVEDYNHVINLLRAAKEANINVVFNNADMSNVDFVVLVGCKTKRIFDIAIDQLESTIKELPCPENVFPIVFCNEEIKFFNKARYSFE